MSPVEAIWRGSPLTLQVMIAVRDIEVSVDPWTKWAERIEALGVCPLVVRSLKIAGSDIVTDGIPIDVILRILRRDVAVRACRSLPPVPLHAPPASTAAAK